MRNIGGVALSAAVLVGIAGCGNLSGGGAASHSAAAAATGTGAGTGGTATVAATDTATAAATGSASATAAGGGSTLALRLAVPARQMGAGWTSRTIPDGDQVQGQVTLDLCGARYPSENLRTARHQILLTSSTGSGSAERISNEVVIYQPGGAQQARGELLQAIATCPSAPVEGAVSGEGMVTYKISVLPSDARWLPGTVAVSAVETDSSGQSVTQVAIYQFRGDAMSAIYGPATTDGQADPADLKAAADAATILASTAAAP